MYLKAIGRKVQASSESRNCNNYGVDYDIVRILMLEVAELMDVESLMWQQRSRALHLRSGDSNTQFFHNKESQRYRRNRIIGLWNKDNLWFSLDSQIADIVVDF